MHSAMSLFSLQQSDFPFHIQLAFDDQHYQIKSNSETLLQALSEYFKGYESNNTNASVDVFLFQDEVQKTDIEWQNWPREAGKTRQKEQYFDASDGRWIHKMKTGMVLFQHLTAPLAVGPCEQYLSQTVNFIINQHINHLQQQGGLICHAACLKVKDAGICIAALSGGGKSTTMLKLMDLPDSQFVSNDRLFLFSDSDGVTAHGVAKQPRVNPGTLLNNPRLINILSEHRQQQLKAMPKQELWQLEEKYDVMVEQIYGKAKLAHSTPLKHVILLNWQPGNMAPVKLTQVSLKQRPELIKAIAKSPGSFYQNAEGQFLTSAVIPENKAYQEALSKVMVWEASGGADFEQLIELLIDRLALQ